MANPNVFALQNSELNGFLYADVGTEPSGMPLSVLSALSRLGMDPWQEAGRLAKLPHSVAVDWLARVIAGLPAGLWPLPVATPIAARLVALLPQRGAGASGPVATQPPTGPERATMRLAMVIALCVSVVAGLALDYVGRQREMAERAAHAPQIVAEHAGSQAASVHASRADASAQVPR